MQHLTSTPRSNAIRPSATSLFLSVAFVFSASASADEITGKIDDWPHDTADIVTGFMEPQIIGQVDADGAVTISFPSDYTQKTIEETEAQNAGDSGWSVSMPTARDAWGCDTDDLEVSNGDQYAVPLATMGSFMVGSMEKDVGYGSLMVANSRAFAERYDPFNGEMTEGWYIDWVHVDTDIMISGECQGLPLSLPEVSLEQVTSYEIKLAPGWNLLKHEIGEVYEDEIGRVWPTRSIYTTVDKLPDEAEVVFVSDE